MTCSAYRFHIPAQPASDSHHVIPQAWQHAWQPDQATRIVLSPHIWDPRTVELCPSCHRSVHERIVALMKHREPPGRDRLWKIAQLALERFTTAGGDLDALRTAHLYGEQ